MRSAEPATKREGEVAVLFLDIEGCTRLCEVLPLREMNEVIETYFSAYLEAIRGQGGEVTEVLGDGLVALFERRPLARSALAAARAAREIRKLTTRLNRRRHGRHDPIVVNLGLNAGRALVGLTRLRGHANERGVYSATGPVTNIAARLCALARGGQILTTRATADLLPAGQRRRMGRRQALKGVSEPVEIVEIL